LALGPWLLLQPQRRLGVPSPHGSSQSPFDPALPDESPLRARVAASLNDAIRHNGVDLSATSGQRSPERLRRPQRQRHHQAEQTPTKRESVLRTDAGGGSDDDDDDDDDEIGEILVAIPRGRTEEQEQNNQESDFTGNEESNFPRLQHSGVADGAEAAKGFGRRYDHGGRQ